MLSLLGWIGSLIVIGSYFLSAHKQAPNIFHWGNIIGCLLLVPVQLISGIVFAAFLSASFGLIATMALWKQR